MQNADIASVQKLLKPKLAEIDSSGTTVKWGGQAEQMKDSFSSMGNALLLSIALVFILMAALFESFLSPLIIGLAVPQAMAGALIALTITNNSISIPSLIGIIMLVGLVTKNAILLVDYTNTLRREKALTVREALLQAGPIRLRPILMTTFAMISGYDAHCFSLRQRFRMAATNGYRSNRRLITINVPDPVIGTGILRINGQRRQTRQQLERTSHR